MPDTHSINEKVFSPIYLCDVTHRQDAYDGYHSKILFSDNVISSYCLTLVLALS